MNKYSGIRASVKMPQVLANPNSLLNMLHLTRKLIQQVDIQNQFSRGIHSIYQYLAQNVQKSSSNAQSSFNSTGGPNSAACKEVVKTVYIMFRHLGQQSFKNIITLKTIAKTEKDQPLLKSMTDKIEKIKQKSENYIKIFNNYHALELTYVDKSQKFENVDVKPVKYYSVDAFNQKINKIKQIEIQLQKILDRLKLEHATIQTLYKEVKKILTELLYNKIKRIYDIISLSREVLISMMTFEEIIIEEGSRDYMTNNSDQSVEDLQSTTPDEAIKAAKNMIEKERHVRQILEEYLLNILRSVEQFKRQIVNSDMSKVLIELNREKKSIEGSIGLNLYYEKIDSEEELKKFCVFLDKLMDRVQINKLTARYRKMQDDLIAKLQIEITNMVKEFEKNPNSKTNQKTYQETKAYLKKKYMIQAESINGKFKKDVLLLIKLLKQLREGFSLQFKPFKRPEQQKIEQQINNIFKSEHYKLLNNSFIMEPNQYKFQRSPYVSEFINLRNIDNNVDNISVDLSSHEKPTTRSRFMNKALCCHSQTRKDQNIIDQFNCALNNKILLQGKLTLYKKQIKFKSVFNNTTLFGKTKLLIPIRDIIQIDKDDHLLNSIFIQTTHGILRFVSFLTNPIPIMKHYYINSKQSSLPKPTLQSNVSPIKHYQNMTQENNINSPSQQSLPTPMTEKLKIKLMNLAYKQNKSNQMYKQYSNGNILTTQTVKFKEENDLVIMSILYTQQSIDQEYQCHISRNDSGGVQTHFILSSTTKQFKDEFITLTRSVVSDDIVRINSQSQIFDVSSIGQKSNYRITVNQKQEQKTCELTPKSILKVPNTQDSLMIDLDLDNQKTFQSRISYTSKMPKIYPQQQKIKLDQKPEVSKEQHNPMVLYIVLGLVVFVLAVII